MSKHKILVATFHAALAKTRKGETVDTEFLNKSDRQFRELRDKYPDEAGQAVLDPYGEEPDITDPWEEIEIELSSSRIRRIIEPLGPLVEERLRAIKDIVLNTMAAYPSEVR